MSNIIIYDPTGVVINCVTNYLISVNTPDYSSNVLVNPDVSQLSEVPIKYWKVSSSQVIEMNSTEKQIIDDFLLAKTNREKKYKVLSYDERNNLSKESWYDTDNGDGTYLGKSEETTYAYDNSLLLSRTVVIYYYDGTVQTTLIYDYYKNDAHELIEKLRS
jgi:hypothetical protein